MSGLLLDTHAFLWWLDGDPRLPAVRRQQLLNPDAEVYVSAVSAWEIAIKSALGKLPGADDVARDVAHAVRGQGFRELPMLFSHAHMTGRLPGHHRDPFDRLLIAQGLVEDMAIISIDTAFDAYGVERLWG